MCVDTFFAPSARTDFGILKKEIKILSNNTLMDSLLRSVSGLIAVLDENRQIVNVNDSFLESLGFKTFNEIAGLRPGEALNCKYKNAYKGGCGTSKFCSSCGAAIAITTCQASNKSVEKLCALKQIKNGEEHDLCLKIKCSPIYIDDRRFLLLFIQDVTRSYISSYLERIFFHDLNNLINGLYGIQDLLRLSSTKEKILSLLSNITNKLKNEVDAQRIMSKALSEEFHVEVKKIYVADFFCELNTFFEASRLTTDKKLEIIMPEKRISVLSDYSLLSRVIVNMITNALEASANGDIVKVWIEEKEGCIYFNVWNNSFIPEDIQLRVFQKFFSTKQVEGRGLGTFSMKIFGEKFLKGRVDFTTSIKGGTIFWLMINS